MAQDEGQPTLICLSYLKIPRRLWRDDRLLSVPTYSRSYVENDGSSSGLFRKVPAAWGVGDGCWVGWCTPRSSLCGGYDSARDIWNFVGHGLGRLANQM